MAASSRSALLVVGEVDADSALVTSKDHSVPLVFRLPLALLPAGVACGTQHSSSAFVTRTRALDSSVVVRPSQVTSWTWLYGATSAPRRNVSGTFVRSKPSCALGLVELQRQV